MMPIHATAIPLRERKHARTRLALLKAALGQLQNGNLDTLSVQAVCDAAEVSPATFFNYFPRKADLIAYAGQLWSLELCWHGWQAAQQRRGLAVIEAVFAQCARQVLASPGLMPELITHQARLRDKPVLPTISRAERLYAFPELQGLEGLPVEALDVLLHEHLQAAIDAGELPPNTLVSTTLVAMMAIFYGVPLAFRQNPAGLAAMYRQQLALLWAGVRGAA